MSTQPQDTSEGSARSQVRVYRDREVDERDAAADFTSALIGEFEGLNLEVHKASRQLKEQVHTLLGARSGRAIEPFADPFKLNDLLFNSTWHSRCVSLVARVSGGSNWQVKPREKGRAAEELDQVQRDRLMAFLKAPNPGGQNINDLLECLAVDLVAQGNAYLEVIRDGRGRVVELWHLPAVSMRVATNGKGFWQVGRRLGTWGTRFFLPFGQRGVAIDNISGEPATSETPEPQLASEVIHLRAYHPASKVYGVPWFLAAVLPMQSNRAAAEYNASFFANNTIPRKIIVFRGMDPGEEAEAEVRDWFKVKAKGRPHLPLIIALDENPEAKVDVIERIGNTSGPALTCAAASSLTASPGFAAMVAAASSCCPSVESGGSVPPAAVAAWPARPPTWSTTSCPRCRSASGC